MRIRYAFGILILVTIAASCTYSQIFVYKKFNYSDPESLPWHGNPFFSSKFLVRFSPTADPLVGNMISECLWRFKESSLMPKCQPESAHIYRLL